MGCDIHLYMETRTSMGERWHAIAAGEFYQPRYYQPQAGEDANEEAERTSPPPSDGAPPAPGGIGAGEDHSQCDWCNTMLDSFAEHTGIDLRPVSR